MNLGLTSIEFLFLLPLVIFIYYLLPQKIKQYYLLLINLLFYASFGYQYLTLIALEALLVWLMSAGKTDGIKYILAILILVGILLTFRVLPFVTDSIVAPLGLSFYSLQAVSYAVDVKKGIIEPEKNYIKLLTYLSFFPTITSGPIYRYKDFITSHNANIVKIKADYYRITNGIIYMLYGYFLKLAIAERAAIPVNNVFDDFESAGYGGILLFIIAVTYSVQIFADFAGYSAIVIGIAQILGYDIPENFNAPYLSKSIKEFWSRWHISLSTWLRDYIYIPLGGNRKGKFRKYVNILITFTVSGLWHGFHWHYLIWGLCHGLYQIIGDVTGNIREQALPYIGIKKRSFFHRLLQRMITFILVMIAWVFFRTGAKSAFKYVTEMCTSLGVQGMIEGRLWSTGLSPFGWIVLFVCVMIMIFVDHIQYSKKIRIDEAVNDQGPLAKGMIVIVMSLVILILGIYGDQHDASYFVYRDF